MIDTIKAILNHRKIRKFAVEAVVGIGIGVIGIVTDAPAEFYLSDGGVIGLLQVRRFLRDWQSNEPPK